jgi:hypothetical protein
MALLNLLLQRQFKVYEWLLQAETVQLQEVQVSEAVL